MDSSQPRKRRRLEVSDGPKQRNGNACRRCQRKKLKCQFSSQHLDRCLACGKSDFECVFDVSASKIPGGAAYVAALEARVAALENGVEDAVTVSDLPEQPRHAPDLPSTTRSQSPAQLDRSRAQTLTIFSLLKDGPELAKRECGILPSIPSLQNAKRLVEITFLYTQARYSIVDWVKIRKWHHDREAVLFPGDDPDRQRAAFFLWMIYAIGAQFTTNPEISTAAYFARAIQFLHVALGKKDVVALQALLVLTQYYFRVQDGPSPWELSGLALQLCVELGYHRKSTELAADPLQHELRKRLFWAAYGYDRLFSMMSKRPFRIHDLDIDVEIPLDVDADCDNPETIAALQQIMQTTASEKPLKVTTMSSTISQIGIYRLKSRIVNRFGGPHALPVTTNEVMDFFAELDDWKQDALWRDSQYSAKIPGLGAERIRSAYLQGVLHLVRPMLRQTIPPPELLHRCAKLSAAACDNAKQLCLHPETQNSLMTICNCFHYGITLLQCLAAQPDVLPLQESFQAITACSTALAVYTKTLPADNPPFFALFDKLSQFFFQSAGTVSSSLTQLRVSISQLLDCGPSQIAPVLEDLLKDDRQEDIVELPAHPAWSSIVDPSLTFDMFETTELLDMTAVDDDTSLWTAFSGDF